MGDPFFAIGIKLGMVGWLVLDTWSVSEAEYCGIDLVVNLFDENCYLF